MLSKATPLAVNAREGFDVRAHLVARTLQQYGGLVHRIHYDKIVVRAFDYVEAARHIVI